MFTCVAVSPKPLGLFMHLKWNGHLNVLLNQCLDLKSDKDALCLRSLCAMRFRTVRKSQRPRKGFSAASAALEVALLISEIQQKKPPFFYWEVFGCWSSPPAVCQRDPSPLLCREARGCWLKFRGGRCLEQRGREILRKMPGSPRVPAKKFWLVLSAPAQILHFAHVFFPTTCTVTSVCFLSFQWALFFFNNQCDIHGDSIQEIWILRTFLP